MKKLLVVGLMALSAAQSLIGPAHAESKRVCSGELSDMRAIGVTLGDCDLNNISDADYDLIRDRCGAPGTIDTDTRVRCRVVVIAGPRKPNIRGVRLYQVRKVLQVRGR